MLRLAGPVVLAELSWMAMSVVDTIMVGRLSAEALGAVSLGSVIFYTVGVFGAGMLLGLDTLVPQEYGAGNLDGCHRSLFQAVYGVLVLGPMLMAPMFLLIPWLERFGIAPEVATLTGPYSRALLWSTLPLLLFMTFRQYLQGMNRVRAITATMIAANLVNILANWVFIFGNLGFKAYGVAGAGWASCASRIFMCVTLLGYLLWDARKNHTGLFHASRAVDPARLWRLARLGAPAATQRALEIGVFAAATAVIGTLDAVSLAAHQLAINAASVTFMVPLGISSAAAVRVGQAIGRRDPEGAHRAGWTALALGAGFMVFAGLLFYLVPHHILRIFTNEEDVIHVGIALLYVAAVFQLCDGLQVVATGALRGAGDTRTAMLANLFGHWTLGLPIGLYLCFRVGWGAVGIWIGLSIGLIAVGFVLLAFWATRLDRLRAHTAGV